MITERDFEITQNYPIIFPELVFGNKIPIILHNKKQYSEQSFMSCDYEGFTNCARLNANQNFAWILIHPDSVKDFFGETKEDKSFTYGKVKFL